MMKKIVLTTLGGAVTTFFVGWLIFGLILANTMEGMIDNAACMAAEPSMFYIALV